MFITITNNNTIQNTPSRGFSVKLREKETETREKDAEPIYILRKPEKISLRVTNRSSIRFSKKKKKTGVIQYRLKYKHSLKLSENV